MHWMIMPFTRFAEFNGRSRRLEYWMFYLLNLIVCAFCVVLIMLGFGEKGLLGLLGSGWSTSVTFGLSLLVAWLLITFIPNIALIVRRFHDQDLAGWMILFAFLPVVGNLVILVFMAIPGTVGPNRYGEDPLTVGGLPAPQPSFAPSPSTHAFVPASGRSAGEGKLRLSGFDARGHVVKTVLDGNDSTLCETGMRIGRGAHCDLVINDMSVSRDHALILFDRGNFRISDLRSTNGVLVNARRLALSESSALSAGDLIMIGKVELSVTAG